MTEEEINRARKRYESTVKKNSRLANIKKELEVLKKSADVIRYLELIKYEEEKLLTDAEIIDDSFSWEGYATRENRNLYFFRGSYQDNGLLGIYLSNDSLKDKVDYFNVYTNIETTETIYIGKEEIVDFEKKNTIINIEILAYLKKITDYDKISAFYDECYKLVRREYFKLLINNPENKAISKLKKLSPISINSLKENR